MQKVLFNYIYHASYREKTVLDRETKRLSMFAESHFSSILLYTTATTEEDRDISKQGKKRNTNYRKQCYSLCILCLSMCVFDCACGNGSSGRDHRNLRTGRITTSSNAGQFRSVTFHIMIRYHWCMTNHHFWHCGCINCLHTTSSITLAGRS